jgi:hypothetical protein
MRALNGKMRAVIEHVSVSADPPGANTATYFITWTIGPPATSNFREVPIFTARTQGTNVVIGSHMRRMAIQERNLELRAGCFVAQFGAAKDAPLRVWHSRTEWRRASTA